MNSERNYYEHLVKIMLTTRGVRFSVAESEQGKEKISLVTISVLSIYLASWSLVTVIFPEFFDSFQNRALACVSVVASVSLLVLSIFDYAAGRSVFAEKMLQNAFEITSILRAAERELARSEPDYEKLSKFSTAYEETLMRAGINHSSADYKVWLIEKETPSGKWHKCSLWLKRKFLRLFKFLNAMVFQLLLVFLIIGSSVYIIIS